MKRILLSFNNLTQFTILVLLTILVSSCAKSNFKQEPYLVLEPNGNLIFSAKESQKEVIIKSNMLSWELNIIKDTPWCVVEKDPDGASKIIIIVSENTEYVPRAEDYILEIVAKNDETTLVEKLKISQKSKAKDIKDLSASGTANCYIIESKGIYTFNHKVKGNGSTIEGFEFPTELATSSVELVWQTDPNMIKEVYMENQLPYFIVGDAFGNALLAAKDATGNIIWTWHIWYPEQKAVEKTSSNGYRFLNMNLGALNFTVADAKSYGLLYQWGRKDPFPGSPTPNGDVSTTGVKLYDISGNEVKITISSTTDDTNNTLEYSIANPSVFISNKAHETKTKDWLKLELANNALWGNPKGAEKDEENNYPNKGEKSIFDPCPVGWRVPPIDATKHLTTSGGYSVSIDEFSIFDYNNDGSKSIEDYDHGWMMLLSDNSASYFPAAARYDGSYGMLMGSVAGNWGTYWGNSPYLGETLVGAATAILSFSVKNLEGAQNISMTPNAGGSRADAYSVRCIK